MGGNTPQVERMRKQGYTEEEIEDMLKCDQEIDRGADLFPLSAELEKGAKKARRADRTDTPKKANRERKIDPDKVEIIGVLNDAICDLADDVGEVMNEREFLFTYNGRKFKVVLSCPRNQGQGFCVCSLTCAKEQNLNIYLLLIKKFSKLFSIYPLTNLPKCDTISPRGEDNGNVNYFYRADHSQCGHSNKIAGRMQSIKLLVSLYYIETKKEGYICPIESKT